MKIPEHEALWYKLLSKLCSTTLGRVFAWIFLLGLIFYILGLYLIAHICVIHWIWTY